MTGVEGLWPHNLSPNRLAVLERKLVLWLQEQPLPADIHEMALHYNTHEDLQLLTQKAATQGCHFADLQTTVQGVISAKTDNFLDLAEIAGLNPLEDFADAKLLGANLRGLTLSGAKLTNAYLRGADLSDIDLTCSDLRNANLGGADLSGALLSDADLTGADLHRVSLALANLSGSNLTNVNLEEANLSNCNLSDANLTGACLKNADLYQAGLALTNLVNVDFTGANVKEARLWHDSGISDEVKADLIHRGAIFDEKIENIKRD
ncbi:pentapeptide repeat-containing protein [Planktothrix mougeotii]|uniref:Pentapeptide repeat-containing protein n=1 Tax=Planktothrix mougeotii LEGE 06226 TaxID=1828728 RepID=A0ABR9UBG6_9CYAN|nr:pentapeptide repeat-containing protein [Planktothrix mougeotii]MBE9143796.1 pentapeptide repeat-containing protein [Planktothrix mougeotii LEGE 06226]